VESALSASKTGLQDIDRARKRLGWNRQSALWADRALTSVATLKQFWRGERITRESFIAICQAVGVEDWSAITREDAERSDPIENLRASTQVPTPIPSLIPLNVVPVTLDWGDAPETRSMIDRARELAQLQNWIVTDRAKLVTIVGMGGMGKTTLSVHVVEQLQSEFEVVLWRSLSHGPTLEMVLTDCLRRLTLHGPPDPNSDGAGEGLAVDSIMLIDRFFQQIRDRRCLIILDNFESVLTTPSECYSQFLHRIGETRHQSCILITSREMPQSLVRLEGDRVQTLFLTGLSETGGTDLLAQFLSQSSSQPPASLPNPALIDRVQLAEIVRHYAGNPLALKIVAPSIRELLQGDLSTFLSLMQQGSFWFADLQDLLERQVDRLSSAEREVMFWLALLREPTNVETLRHRLLSIESKLKLLDTLEHLRRRSLLEVTHQGYALQPAILEYITARFVDLACGDLVSGIMQQSASTTTMPAKPYDIAQELRNHPLYVATASDWIQAANRQWILIPIVTRLRSIFQRETDLQQTLLKLLQSQRQKPLQKIGYWGGSVFNLLNFIQTDFTGQDLSQLHLWQADLHSRSFHQVNFSHTDLTHSRLTHPFSNVISVAFHPDGNLLAQSDDRGYITIWDCTSGQQVQTWQAHGHWIFDLAFSPDGEQIACASLDQTASLWDWKTLHQTQHFIGHTEGLSAIVFHPNLTLLATCSADKTIRVFDTVTGECKATLIGHEGIIKSIAWIADTHQLISVGLDQQIKHWDISTQTCLYTQKFNTPIYTLVMLNETEFVTAGEDGNLYQSDLEGHILPLQKAHGDRIWSMAILGDQLVTSSDDRTVKLWEQEPGGNTWTCTQTFYGHESRIWSVAVAGNRIASGGDDRTMRLWQASPAQRLKTFQGYQNATTPIAFTDAGSGRLALMSFSEDQVLRQWELNTRSASVLLLPSEKPYPNILRSPDGRWLAGGSLKGLLSIYAVDSGVRSHCIQAHENWVRSIAFSPDSRSIVSVGGDAVARRWDVDTGACLQEFLGHHSPIQTVTWSGDGTLVATGSWDGTVRLWSVETGNFDATVACDGVVALAFTIDGQTLIAASQSGSIAFLSVPDLHRQPLPIGLPALSEGITTIGLSPDGQQLAIVTPMNILHVYQFSSNALKTLTSQDFNRNSNVTFNASGSHIAIGSNHGAVWVWDLTQVNNAEPIELQIPRPYEGCKMTGAIGLTAAQRSTMQTLGAK
jgi:WD40 repeat protein